MVHFSIIFLALISLATGRWVITPDHVQYDEVLENNIRENAKRGGNVHGHIVAVNDAFRLSDNKRASSNGDIALTEVIEADNEAAHVNLFEGDIHLPDEESNDLSQSDPSKRNIVTSKARLWPSKEVPYYLSPELDSFKSKVVSAVAEIEKKTCVRFKEVPGSYYGDHIRLVKGRGCSSSVGRRGGGQKLYLGKGCEYKGVIIHEMMHSLGIWHEQSRPDRDRYIEILWHNISPGKRKNFRKYSHGKLDQLNLEYDTSSIMHYDRFLFSVSPGKRPTIIARGRPWVKLGGQLRGTLTDNDAKEINSLFNCA